MNAYAEQVANLTDEELRKHANIAMHHGMCADCFCCAALDEQRSREGRRADFEKNKSDLMLTDTCVIFRGNRVELYEGKRKEDATRLLASVSLNARSVLKLMAWCVKNHYRCSSIDNGQFVP